MREVIAAIREGLPDADQMQPGAVFQHVLEALRDCLEEQPKYEQFYTGEARQQRERWRVARRSGSLQQFRR